MDTQVTEEDKLMVQGFHKLKEMEARLKEMLDQPKPSCLRDEPQRPTFAAADRNEDSQKCRAEAAKPLLRSNTSENPGGSDATHAAKDRLKRVFDNCDVPSRPHTPVSLQASENLKNSVASAGYYPRRFSEAKAADHSGLLGRSGFVASHNSTQSNGRPQEHLPDMRRLPENQDRSVKIEDLERKIFKLRQENTEFNPTTSRRPADPHKTLHAPPKTPTAAKRLHMQTRVPPPEHAHRSTAAGGPLSAGPLHRFVPKLEVPLGSYHRNTSFGQIEPMSTDSLNSLGCAYQQRYHTEKTLQAAHDPVFERQADTSARERMQARAPQAHFYNPNLERHESNSDLQKIDRLYSSFLENKKFWEDFKAKRESSKKTHLPRGREQPSAHPYQVQKEYGIPADRRDAFPGKKKVEEKEDWCDSSDLSDITERKHYNKPEKPERTRLLHK